MAIARAPATQPRLLLMDEPLASLDQPRKAEILPYLERLHEKLAIPGFCVSHAPAEVARLADRILVLETGQMAVVGPAAAMLIRLDLSLARALEIGAGEGPRLLVKLGLGAGREGTDDAVLARITPLSRDRLALTPGQAVYAQVKAVALME